MSFYFIEPVHLQQVQVHPRNGLDQSLKDDFQRILNFPSSSLTSKEAEIWNSLKTQAATQPVVARESPT